MRNWVLVANAARARLLEETDKAGRFVHVAALIHPESRMKGSELAWDRPGRVEGSSHGTGSSAFDPRTGVRQREREHFAREVAAAIDEGIRSGRCAGVTLVASDRFLGEVKAHLSAAALERVLRTVAADYTALSDAELAQRLAAG